MHKMYKITWVSVRAIVFPTFLKLSSFHLLISFFIRLSLLLTLFPITHFTFPLSFPFLHPLFLPFPFSLALSFPPFSFPFPFLFHFSFSSPFPFLSPFSSLSFILSPSPFIHVSPSFLCFSFLFPFSFPLFSPFFSLSLFPSFFRVHICASNIWGAISPQRCQMDAWSQWTTQRKSSTAYRTYNAYISKHSSSIGLKKRSWIYHVKQ